jgi:hypothetical protein
MVGVPDAPDLSETVQNFAVNSGALALLVFLLLRDRQKANRELKVIEREEMLAKLEVWTRGGYGGCLAPKLALYLSLINCRYIYHLTQMLLVSKNFK